MSEEAVGKHAFFSSHPRDWRENLYVYPVISRRSRGLSIGVNLNPDTACNFDCIYCQVDRSAPVRARRVDIDRLTGELRAMLSWAAEGTIFDEAHFGHVPDELRRVNDIAFSGDGEPTTCPVFVEAVEAAAELKRSFGLAEVKTVLITDACYLTKPEVVRGLKAMDESNGEIWAKLDAGTQAYFERINRPNYPLSHVMENIISAARVRPISIQTLFMKICGEAPSRNEVDAYLARLGEVVQAGGVIHNVQIYTVARKPAEDYVTPLCRNEIDEIAGRVRDESHLPATAYYAD